MSTTIKLKKSGQTGNIPSNTELDFGELALNYADGVLYYKNASNDIAEISGTSANTFETINANGTLLIADSNTDVLTISPGTGINVTGNALTDSVEVSVRFNDNLTSQATDLVATANSVNAAANIAYAAYNKANAPITIKEVYASNAAVVNTFSNISTIQFDADSGMAVVDEGNNAVTIQLNSTFKTWNVNGGPGLVAFGLDTVNFVSANGITLSANNLSSPKTFTIDATELPNAYAQANAAYNLANTVANSGANNQILYRDAFNIIEGNDGLQYDGFDLQVDGVLKSIYQDGDEGGEIYLNKPVTNTSIDTGIVIDVYQDKIRFFEAGGNNRGVFIDFTATPAGVGRDLLAGGPQGPQGFQGETGAQGFQGATGPQGPQGHQGIQGATGSQGFQGETGPQGPQGFQGVLGPQGYQGVQGEIGAQGVQGSQGVQGATGPQGSQGAQGEIGAQGYQGFQGETGPQGPQGLQGVQGHQGYQGFQGETGPQGVQGVQGHQGYQGIQGAIGPQGFQGVLGAQGPQGVQGAQGAQGATGTFGGASFDYEFRVETNDPADLGNGHLQFNANPFNTANTLYISFIDKNSANVYNFMQTIDDSTSTIKGNFKVANTANVNEYAFFNIVGNHIHDDDHFNVPIAYTTGSVTSFANTANIVISLTRTGDKGDTGAQGPQGVQGAIGSQGFQGADGAQGAVGAQGVQGAIGPQGPQGFQGVEGAQGSVGAQGVQGAIGPQGPQGFQGVIGAQGAIGAQGVQGAVGAQGAQGVQGATGAPGAQGAQGVQGAPGVNPGGTTNFVAKFTGATTIADSTIFDDGTIVRVNSTFGLTNTVSTAIVSATKSTTFVTSSVSEVAVDTFASATYRSAKYFVQMTSGSAYHVIELNLVHDGTTVYLVQYAENKSGASLGTFDADINSGNARLLLTPANSSTTVKLHRITIAV
jgi:hypothetical protein